MIIDISKIDDEFPFEFSPKVEDLDLQTANYRLPIAPIVTGSVTRHIGAVVVNGKIVGTAEIDCTRCLNPVAQPFSIDFDVEFLTEGQMGRDGEHELNFTDLDTDQLDSDQLDLNQVAREQILLNIPEQQFCREDCKGICPKCGENLNLIDCKCGEDEIDPRWAALKDLKNNF